MKAVAIRTGGAIGLALALTVSAAVASPPSPGPATPSAADFFESRVRPVLAENCFACHGGKHQKGGLRLDSRALVLQGSDAGPVLVPGDPGQSALIRAIRYDGDKKMPPKGKLPPEAVEALTVWVKMGAPWPEVKTAQASPSDPWKTHWAFQAVQKPTLPKVKNSAWVRSPVDAFILAKLEDQGLAPSPPADRRTLLRRATFDLTGLPPTPQEVAAFEADPSPEAFARVVDRLLASPRYGERWGRYWLDVARYADNKGYVFTQERAFPCSYTYRDYVIRAFNDDLPYDQFILQQLAADQLTLGEDRRPLAALGYLTVGSHFMNNPNDIIDDRIDVVCRGLLGLTVTCARCHDHKFDPIPTQDYYSLYGVFASSTEPSALPVIAVAERNAATLAYEKELHSREEKLNQFLQAKLLELNAGLRARLGEYLLAARVVSRQPANDEFMVVTDPGDLNRRVVQRWKRFLETTRTPPHPVFAPWHAFASLPDKEFAARAPALAAQFAANADPQYRLNPLVANAFAGKPPASLQEVAQRYGRLFAAADKLWQQKTQGAGKGPPPGDSTKLNDPDQEQIRQVLYAPRMPANISLEEVEKYLLDRPTRNKVTELRRDLDHFQGTSPNAPPRAMVLVDSPVPVAPHVFLRGNPNKVGEEVPRRFLKVLAGEKRQPFPHGSGRLDLAQAITQKTNPLTARVMVNRIWLHHFGEGLVHTPSDFGLRSEAPTHPELLDYLAWSVMEDGWSVKQLHRLIMLSSAYQQSSDENPSARAVDPTNRLVWKMNRQRLDFEALRDSLLAASGQLNAGMGGPSVQLTTAPFSSRRTVYGYIDRENLPALFRTFDFPNPDATSPQRHQTTVPLQALFLMNSPFVLDLARHLVNRPEVAAQPPDEHRIEVLYRILYGRAADPDEVTLGVRFLQSQDKAPAPGASPTLSAWEKYAQVLLLANEFAFVD